MECESQSGRAPFKTKHYLKFLLSVHAHSLEADIEHQEGKAGSALQCTY